MTIFNTRKLSCKCVREQNPIPFQLRTTKPQPKNIKTFSRKEKNKKIEKKKNQKKIRAAWLFAAILITKKSICG